MDGEEREIEKRGLERGQRRNREAWGEQRENGREKHESGEIGERGG